MKHANKIVALLLCLTLLVSAMAIFVSAAETEAEPETEATQAQSVEPNYTITDPSTTSDFVNVTKSGYDSENNQFRTNNTVTLDGWGKIVTTDVGDKFLSLYEGESTADNRADFYFKSGTREVSSYPVALVQFEAARTGTVTSKGISAYAGTSTSASGFKLNGTVLNLNALNDYAIGETVQISIVYYYTQDESGSVLHATSFINGVAKKTIDSSTLDATTMESCLWVGIRIFWYTGYNILLDNFYTNAFTSTDVLNADKSIKDEYSQFTKAEFKSLSEQLPAIATVNGVEYNTVSAINAELAKTHSVPAEVEFLHDYTATPWTTGEKVAVNCNATINTNGFVTADGLDLTNAYSYAVNGNEITVVCPNYTQSTPANTADAFKEILTSDVSGNGGITVGTPSSNGTTYVHYDNGGVGSISAVDTNGGNLFDVNFSSASNYKFSDYPYAIMQFEAGYIGTCSTTGDFMPMISNGTNSGTGAGLSSLFEDMASGEVAQFTYFFYAIPEAEGSTNGSVKLDIYRNGEVIKSVKWDSVDFTAYWPNAFRAYISTTDNVVFGNVYTKHFTTDPRATDANGNETFGGYNQYLNESFKSIVPAIATVNGVKYNTVDAVNKALHDLPVTIEILHNYVASPWYNNVKITPNCGVNINTNGFVDVNAFTFPEGVTPVVDGTNILAHVANNLGTATTNSDTIKNATNTPIDGNKGVGGANSTNGALGDIVIHESHGNKYYSIYNSTNASNFYQNLYAQQTYYFNNEQGYKYMVMQFDAAYLTPEIGTGDMRIDYYLNATTNKIVKNTDLFNGIEPGEVAQFTLVFYYDAENNECGASIYRNGDFSVAIGSDTRNVAAIEDTPDKCYFRGLRCHFGNSVIAYDNFFVVHSTENPISNGELLDSYNQFVNPNYEKLVLPYVALVDGEGVTYEEIDEALADGANHEVELLHKPYKAITVQSNATIKTNGYTGYIVAGEGYLLEEADGVVTVDKDNRTTNIKVVAGDKVLATIDNVNYSVDHKALILALDNFYHNGAVCFVDGKYYEVVWDYVKADYATEITYEVTLEPARILVVDIINNVVVSDKLTYTDGVLTGGLFNDVNETVVYFNDDITSTANTNALKFANTEWYMNGYTYTWHMASDDTASHGISLMNGAQFVINNGKFDIEYGSSFFIIPNAYVSSTSLTLNDVTINTNTLIADVRSGSMNLNNCVINRGHFMIGARTSTDTYINFTDCTIKSSTSTGSYIAYHNNDGWNTYGVTLDKLPNVDRHVTFTNCKFHLLSGSITSMPAETFAVDIPDGATNNRKVTFVNSEVYSQTAIGYKDGKLIFGEGVKYSIVNGTSGVTAAEGVMLGVKTNDIGFDYIATANYTEFTWVTSGLVELWEVGATPVASDPADKATGDTAAGEYTLTANLTLHANIFFNIYADGATLVTINGKTIEGVDGKYAYELLPASALGDIYVVIKFADDGSVYTRTTNLMEYVNESAEDTSYTYYEQLIQVYANMLQYLLDVQNYEYIGYARAEADTFLAAHAATSVAVENTAISENIGTYFVSATFQLDGDVKLVLTLQDGVTVNAVTVGGVAVATVVVDGKLYVEIPAYLLTETVEVTIGEATVEYSLGAYTTAATDKAQTAATSLYSYAAAAKAYEAACNAQ